MSGVRLRAHPHPGQPEGTQMAARPSVHGVPVADPGGAGVARLGAQLALGRAPLLRRCARMADELLQLRPVPGVSLEQLDRVIEADPTDHLALGSRGQSKVALGRTREALADLDRAVELNGDYTWALVRRAHVRSTLGDVTGALDDLDRAEGLEPDTQGTLGERGNVYRFAGRYEEAVALYDRALALDPGYAWALGSRALANEALGRRTEALADLERAVEMNPRLRLGRGAARAIAVEREFRGSWGFRGFVGERSRRRAAVTTRSPRHPSPLAAPPLRQSDTARRTARRKARQPGRRRGRRGAAAAVVTASGAVAAVVTASGAVAVSGTGASAGSAGGGEGSAVVGGGAVGHRVASARISARMAA